MRVKLGENGAVPECKSGWKRDVPEKTRRPAASSSKIPTCENPRSCLGEFSHDETTWSGYSPPTWANRIRIPAGSLPDVCMWESCRWSEGLLGDLPFLLLHARLASPFVGFQHFHVTRRPILSSHSPLNHRVVHNSRPTSKLSWFRKSQLDSRTSSNAHRLLAQHCYEQNSQSKGRCFARRVTFLRYHSARRHAKFLYARGRSHTDPGDNRLVAHCVIHESEHLRDARESNNVCGTCGRGGKRDLFSSMSDAPPGTSHVPVVIGLDTMVLLEPSYTGRRTHPFDVPIIPLRLHTRRPSDFRSIFHIYCPLTVRKRFVSSLHPIIHNVQCMARWLDHVAVECHRSVRLHDTRHLTLRHYTENIFFGTKENVQDYLHKLEHILQPAIAWTHGCIDESLGNSLLFRNPLQYGYEGSPHHPLGSRTQVPLNVPTNKSLVDSNQRSSGAGVGLPITAAMAFHSSMIQPRMFIDGILKRHNTSFKKPRDVDYRLDNEPFFQYQRHLLPVPEASSEVCSRIGLSSRIFETSIEQRRNARVGKTGDPRENPLTSCIVLHESHVQESREQAPRRDSNLVRLDQPDFSLTPPDHTHSPDPTISTISPSPPNLIMSPPTPILIATRPILFPISPS
ncbi:hypothetical protein PR048_026317 [Dryococelus australis]|uniref:Uncharacterized protein n=1 Tax=Dryococelus australis TaxID=614101 RepID=A0ABQ9GKZ8_9NEOP|nr:hypothetical protein PR048_026317 [Dryococelus australis]